jgi:cytosine permease
MVGQWMNLSGLMMGSLLIEGLSFAGLVLCVVVGGGILLICTVFMGMRSCRTGLPSTALSAEGLGVRGAALFFGAIMTLSAVYGYRAVKYLFSVVEPILFAVLLFLLIRGLLSPEVGTALSAWRPIRPMSYIQGITMVVSLWIMGAFISGDFARYAKTPREAATALVAGLAPVIPATLLSGGEAAEQNR